MSKFSVSVIIPTKNRSNLLSRAIRSVELQTVKPNEVIVIDDGSDEKELQAIENIVREFQLSLNIIFLKNKFSQGANYCRNIGISSATSRYIAFLDSDDFWLPEKLALQSKQIRDNPADKVLCTTGRYRIGTAGDVLAIQYPKRSLTEVSIRESNFLGPLSSAIVSKSAAQEILGFNESLPSSQDWDFFIRLTRQVQHLNLSQPLLVYHDHELERISLNQNGKIAGLLAILNDNLKNQNSHKRIRNGEIYKSLAEAYQQNANNIKARLYYWMYLLERIRDGKYVNLLNLFRPVPDLKKERYHRYDAQMSRLLKSEEIKIRFISDKHFIDSIF